MVVLMLLTYRFGRLIKIFQVEKQIVVELFCVMGTIIRRHPELSFGENEVLDLPKLIDQAVEMYSRLVQTYNLAIKAILTICLTQAILKCRTFTIVSNLNLRHGEPQSSVSAPIANKFDWPSSQTEDNKRKQFFEESVSTTSIFLAKVIFIL